MGRGVGLFSDGTVLVGDDTLGVIRLCKKDYGVHYCGGLIGNSQEKMCIEDVSKCTVKSHKANLWTFNT